MEKFIQELERIAEEMRKADERMSAEVREGGKQSQEAFEKVTQAVHRFHSFLYTIPDKLQRIARGLKRGK